jgi:glucosamine-6-phosphate deaminase
MTIKVYPNYQMLSKFAADLVIDYIQKKPQSIVCIASGDTPKGVCEYLVEAAKNKHVDFSQTTFVGLDEWVGMDENDKGSCKNFVYDNLFRPLSIEAEKIKYFDAKSTDLQGECDKINGFIAQNGGLDIMLVGVGLNGHIALNEPNTPFYTYAHVSDLEEVTKEVGQKYFSQKTELTHGITLGLGHFKEAKLPILMASGIKKSAIMQNSILGEITESVPASIIQTISHGLVLLDKEAGTMIN